MSSQFRASSIRFYSYGKWLNIYYWLRQGRLGVRKVERELSAPPRLNHASPSFTSYHDNGDKRECEGEFSIFSMLTPFIPLSKSSIFNIASILIWEGEGIGEGASPPPGGTTPLFTSPFAVVRLSLRQALQRRGEYGRIADAPFWCLAGKLTILKRYDDNFIYTLSLFQEAAHADQRAQCVKR